MSDIHPLWLVVLSGAASLVWQVRPMRQPVRVPTVGRRNKSRRLR
ncbi:MAG: hypothetical protein VKO21_05180 [Candidatus Sericytochromatia bacterium]|nr:hypothetical protein [Candidatus Sericytochromatia bacterium]